MGMNHSTLVLASRLGGYFGDAGMKLSLGGSLGGSVGYSRVFKQRDGHRWGWDAELVRRNRRNKSNFGGRISLNDPMGVSGDLILLRFMRNWNAN